MNLQKLIALIFVTAKNIVQPSKEGKPENNSDLTNVDVAT